MRVEVISGVDAGSVLDLDDGSAVVGRAPGLDLTLTDGRVSTRHLRVQVDPGGATVTDLGSTNGTTLGSRRLPPDQPTPLDEGARIGLGDTVLQVTGLRAGPTGTVIEGAAPPVIGPAPTAIGQPPPAPPADMPRIVPPSPQPVAAEQAPAAPPPFPPAGQPPRAPVGGGGGGGNRNLLIGAGIGAAVLIVGVVAALAFGGSGSGDDTTTAVLPPTTTQALTTDSTPTESLTTPTDTVPTDTVPTDTVPTDTVPTDTVPTDTTPTDTGATTGDVNDPATKLALDQSFGSDSGPGVSYPSGWTVSHVGETDKAYETLDLSSASSDASSNMHMRVIIGAPHNFEDFDNVSSLFARAKSSAEDHGYLDWKVTQQSTPKDGTLGNAPAQAAGFQWDSGSAKGRGVIFAARDPKTKEWVFGWAAFVDSNADDSHVQARDDTIVDLVSSLTFK